MRLAVRAILPILSIAVAGNAVRAADEPVRTWSLQLEPIYVQAEGHDRHVLTIHSIDADGSPSMDASTAVNLETESGLAYGLALRHQRGRWGFGLDFFWFDTSQGRERRTASADGPAGTIDEVVFETSSRDYASTDPGEVLYFAVLEDTDLALWTVDLLGARTLAEGPSGRVEAILGLRLGDFDNDVRTVVGVEGVGGSSFDASSNYDRMTGPVFGLAGELVHGKHTVRGGLRQAWLLGNVELGSTVRDFTGPVDAPVFVAQESFLRDEQAAVPITELRVDWRYRVSDRFALGVGTSAASWWDLPVPPGVEPAAGGATALHESTIVLLGLIGTVEIRF